MSSYGARSSAAKLKGGDMRRRRKKVASEVSEPEKIAAPSCPGPTMSECVGGDVGHGSKSSSDEARPPTTRLRAVSSAEEGIPDATSVQSPEPGDGAEHCVQNGERIATCLCNPSI